MSFLFNLGEEVKEKGAGTGTGSLNTVCFSHTVLLYAGGAKAIRGSGYLETIMESLFLKEHRISQVYLKENF